MNAALEYTPLDGQVGVGATAISRDPWFASLRPSPRYTELMRKAELRRSESHVAFLAAGGDQVISVM